MSDDGAEPRSSELRTGLDGLANLIKHFIVRDIIYAIGGGVLLLSAAYGFGSLSSLEEGLRTAPPLLSLLAVGVAWAVGYAVSDGLGGIMPALLFRGWRFKVFGPRKAQLRFGGPRWWPFVRSDYIATPQTFPKHLFESFTQRHWVSAEDAKVSIDQCREAAGDLIDREFGSYHRTAMLRHLGTALGASGLLSTAFIFVGARTHGVRHPWLVAAGPLAISVLLLMIGWVKALQQQQDMIREAVRQKDHPRR